MSRHTSSENSTDWIELAATVLLSLATIVAAWSAYQSARWSGIQSVNFGAAAAERVEAAQIHSAYTAQVQLDMLSWLTYLEQRQLGSDEGAQFIRDRMRDEFAPALDAWLASGSDDDVPAGTPFELPEYTLKTKRTVDALNAEADKLSAKAAEANQVGDNYVLVAVIMATVLFFAGVGTKLWGRTSRLIMLGMGIALYVGGTWFMLSLPLSFGI
jgi:hypothetical protein